MPKLTIVVPHYHEPWDVCKFLFNSLEMQHGIDFNDFDVLIVDDGGEMPLDVDHFGGFTYMVKQVAIPHGGVSAARNYGIDHADGEYVMFCDADDGFLSMYGLHLIFGAIQEGFDFLNSAFIEEQPVGEGWQIFRRDKDAVFIHGKCYRRQFLTDKNIRFDTELHFSEDSVFNNIAYHEAEKRKYIETPFYLWAWNKDSTVRQGREMLVLRKYEQVMLMRSKTCEQLLTRGFKEEFYDTVCKCICDSYYEFNEPQFVKAGHEKLVEQAERAFKKFYRDYSKYFMECDSKRIGKALMQSRATAYDAGLVMERITLKDWLKHIKNDVKL